MSKSEVKYILAHDHGTSGSKAAIVSTHGDVMGFEFQETPLYLFPNGGAEQKPQEWWDAIMKTSKKLIDRQLVPVEDIVAVCDSSQWSCTVPVDKDGEPLYNAISWMDTRGAPYIKKLMGGPISISGYSIKHILQYFLKLGGWINITGGAPGMSGKDPIAHILFLKDTMPDIYEKTYKFLEAKDFINLKLTGKFAASYDSIQLHWVTDIRDINNIHYDKGLIKKFKIDRAKLPDLIRAIDVLGPIKKEVADEIGLQPNTKVVSGTPDLPSAAIGSGAVGDFEGHVYIGTSSWVICHTPHKKTDLFHNIAAIPSAIPGRYFVASEQETAGAALSFLRDNILYHKDELLQEERLTEDLLKTGVYKIFDRIAESAPAGSNKLIFTPWLWGERTPIEDHFVRGGLFNISLKSTRADLIRAILEGVAFNSRWVLQCVEKFVGRQLNPLNIIGGGANSSIWCQIYADILNRNIRQVKDPIQANARGAAFIAAVGLGYINFEDIPKYIQYKKTYTPNPENQQIYDELFAEFLKIYDNNKEMYKRLNMI
ncbi:MAG: FGGY-family carbohydrate kinase [Candidatus Helarchaeota archaeon]|nr:FGGY-family carbohydrate kinase [Candidatus Helarchaeota archaeon]